MTASRMGTQYIEEARCRMDLVRLASEKRRYAAVVREAQECVELFLKGAMRLVAVEPARVHDVSGVLRNERARFPDWFRAHVDRLAVISEEMAGDRGLAFYGDENEEKGPQELFDETDAKRAMENMEFVALVCGKLLP